MKRIGHYCLIVVLIAGGLWWLSRPARPRPIPPLARPAAGLSSPVYDKAALIVEMVESLAATQAQIEALRRDVQARTQRED